MTILEKPKRGRPRAAAENKRSEQVCLRMTTVELGLIDRAIELTHGKTRNTVLISLLTGWAYGVVHRLSEESERSKWPIEQFPGILDEHLPIGVIRKATKENKKNVQLVRTSQSPDRVPVVALAEASPVAVIDPAVAKVIIEQLLLVLQATQPK